MDESQPQHAAPDVPVVIDAKSVARLSGVRAVEVIDGVEHYTYRMLDEDLRMLDWDAGPSPPMNGDFPPRQDGGEPGPCYAGRREAAGRKPSPPSRVAPHHRAGDERTCLPQATARQAGEAGRSILNRLSQDNAALQKLQSKNLLFPGGPDTNRGATPSPRRRRATVSLCS